MDHYNAKLAPKNVQCVILRKVGTALYELGDTSGKKLGVYHAKDMFVA